MNLETFIKVLDRLVNVGRADFESMGIPDLRWWSFSNSPAHWFCVRATPEEREKIWYLLTGQKPAPKPPVKKP